MGLDKDKLMNIVITRIDIPGAVSDIVDQVLEPALQKLVDDTDNPYDNMAKLALYPIIEKLMKEEIQKLWDKLKPDVPAS